MDLSLALHHICTRATLLVAVAAAGALVTAGPGATRSHASASGGTYPAKLEVLRAGVKGGRLDVLADITSRADDDRVRVSFIADGKRFGFSAPVENGRIRFKRLLPTSQRGMSTGIMEISYQGNDRVRPTEVRLRAANGKARLQAHVLSLQNGTITVRGSLADGADGVVRLILSHERPDGSVAEWQGRASIRDDGSWRLKEKLPAGARGGGYLSMQFTGYRPRRIRGGQIAKQLRDGQPISLGEPTSQGQTPAPRTQPQTPVSAPALSLVGIAAWRAPGVAPLSDAQAAGRVQSVDEVRPDNSRWRGTLPPPNAYRPSADELAAFRHGQVDGYGRTQLEYNPLAAHVTGNFSGTTDEILQWVAHKWGIPEDVVRAVALNESSWWMSQLGDRRTVSDPSKYPTYSRVEGTSDVYESLGIMQVRWNPWGLHQGTEPLRWKSTAFNADYWASVVRYYYDGLCYWCGPDYSAGQEWASIGAWYNPSPWGSTGGYIDSVEYDSTQHVWTQAGF